MKVHIADLKPVERVTKSLNKKELIENHAGTKIDYTLKQKTTNLDLFFADIDGEYYHSNYLECLELAWANHYGIVMTPDILWHTLISEAVLIVGKTPQKYANLFTSTPEERKSIFIPSMTGIMPVDLLARELKKIVPTDSDVFLPEFSTSTESSRLARYAAFADLVSPYYTYWVYACGIPYVEVRGVQEDYENVLNRWQEIGKLLSGNEEYFTKTTNRLKEIVNRLDEPALWKDMFYLKRCGSGSQRELYGWWTELYMNQPSLRLDTNFSSHWAKVSYTQVENQEEYEMYHGVFYSNLVEDCLVPNFGSIVYNKLKTPRVEAYDPYKIETCFIGKP